MALAFVAMVDEGRAILADLTGFTRADPFSLHAECGRQLLSLFSLVVIDNMITSLTVQRFTNRLPRKSPVRWITIPTQRMSYDLLALFMNQVLTCWDSAFRHSPLQNEREHR